MVTLFFCSNDEFFYNSMVYKVKSLTFYTAVHKTLCYNSISGCNSALSLEKPFLYEMEKIQWRYHQPAHQACG